MKWTEFATSRRIYLWVFSILMTIMVLIVFPVQDWFPDTGMSIETHVVLMIFLGALCCEYVDSTLGMGYGTTLMPILLLAGFAPLQIVPALLLTEFVTGIGGAVLHHREGNVDLLHNRKTKMTALLLSMLSICGAVVAVTIAVSISKFWLTLLIASIILSVGILIVATTRRQLRYRRGHLVAIGTVAAFNKGLSGGGYGPLVTGGQVISGIPPKHAVAVTSLTEGLTCLVGLIAYLLMAQALCWPLIIPLFLGAVLSVPVATLTVRKLPEEFIRGGVGIATCLLGLLTFVKLFS